MSTFKYQHIIKAPPIDVYNAPADSCGQAGLGDSTVDAHNADHVYQNVGNGNAVALAPTQALCDSIAHKNNFMKRQLTFLLENLSEAYE